MAGKQQLRYCVRKSVKYFDILIAIRVVRFHFLVYILLLLLNNCHLAKKHKNGIKLVLARTLLALQELYGSESITLHLFFFSIYFVLQKYIYQYRIAGFVRGVHIYPRAQASRVYIVVIKKKL